MHPIVFLVILSVLLAAIAAWFRPTDFALKKVEFVWLLLGSLGIFGYIEKSDQMIAVNNIPLERSAADFQWNIVRQVSNSAQDYACGNWTTTEHTPPEGVERYNSRGEACKWFKIQNKKISNTSDRSATAAEYGYKGAIAPVDKYWRYDPLDDAIAEFRKMDERLSNSLEDAKPKLINQLLAFLFPYIFAFALSVRMFKAVGDFLNARDKAGKISKAL